MEEDQSDSTHEGEELILRRVPRKALDFETETLTPAAFSATKNDTDGLSFFDAASKTPEQLDRESRNPGTNWIIGIPRKVFENSQFQLTPTPEHGEGHLSLESLSRGLYETDKAEYNARRERFFREIEGVVIILKRPEQLPQA